MKKAFTLLLSSYLASGYVFPDIAYDQTSATCDNANTLLAFSTADLVRLKYDVDVIIPSRIARLDVAKRGVHRVCDFESGATLLQKNASEGKVKAEGDFSGLCSDVKNAIATLSDELQTLKTSRQYSSRLITSKVYRLDDVLWSVTKTCNLVSDRLLDHSTTLLQKNTHLKSGKKANLFTSEGENLDQICQAVTSSIDNLSDYLEALKANVQSTYINGVLPSRITSLTQTSTACAQSTIQDIITSTSKSTAKAAVKSYAKSYLPYPLPDIIRISDPNQWSYQIPNTETILGPFSYKLSLTKDTLVEMIANGHQLSAGRRLMIRWFVDDSVIGTQGNQIANTEFTHGVYLTDASNSWIPVTYSQVAIVPAGEHVISLRAYSEDPTGAASINGMEVTIKIFNP